MGSCVVHGPIRPLLNYATNGLATSNIKWMVLISDVAGIFWDTNADMEEPRTLPKHGKNVDIN